MTMLYLFTYFICFGVLFYLPIEQRGRHKRHSVDEFILKRIFVYIYLKKIVLGDCRHLFAQPLLMEFGEEIIEYSQSETETENSIN